MKLAAQKNFFALLFSDHCLSLAQSGRTGGLRFFAKKDLPAGVLERGEIKDPGGLQKALVEFLKAYKIKNRFVVVGLPEVRSFTRTFILPSLPIEELADAVRWESEPLLPFSLDEAYLDWMILEKSGNRTRVLVVALPKELVENYASLLESIGLQPVAFEITSLSLARLVPKTKSVQVIVNIEAQEAVLAVIGSEGGIEVSSTISFSNSQESLREIPAAVKSAMVFYRKKVSPDTDKKNSGEKKPGSLVDGSESKHVSQIVLTGQSASTGLAETLKKETGLPTGTLRAVKPELAVLTSLANKEVASPIDERTINLIPPRIQGIYDRESRLRELTAWIKIVCACLFFIFFGNGVVWAKMVFQANEIEKKTIEIQAAESADYREAEKEALFLNNRAQKIVSLADPSSGKLSLLDFLLKQDSTDIQLHRVIYDGEGNSFLVSGVAVNRKSLVQFKEELEKSELIERVQIPLSSLEKEENVDFTVSITSN